jgi:hypothetical protein
MQFSAVALLSLVALAYAAPTPLAALAPRIDGMSLPCSSLPPNLGAL